MKKYKHLMFDTHNLFFRMYYGIKDIYKTDDEAYNATVKKCLSKFKDLEERVLDKDGIIWFLFDNHDSKANLRCELSDDYKYNRKDMPEQFYRYVEIFKSLLMNYNDNLKIVYIERLEADDLVKPLLDLDIEKDSSVMMVSADLDWSRFINYEDREVVLYNYEEIIDKEAFHKRYNFFPTVNRVTLFKTLKGDSSDHIKVGLPRLDDEELYYILNNYSDLLDLLTKGISDNNLNLKTRKRIQENSTKLRVNWNLVNFISLDEIGNNIEEHIYYGRFKRNTLRKYYEMLGINLIVDERYEDEVKNLDSFDDFFEEPRIARK